MPRKPAARIHTNLNNIPALSIPLTGPNAIALRVPVAGSYEIPDGSERRVLVAEGETCLWRVGPPTNVWTENIIEGKK